MARIIYAEDDPIVGKLVLDTLMDEGHAIGIVEDGKTALAVIKNKIPDLIILDCSMPEMGGVEVLRKIRLSLELCHIPVLMLTGRSGETDKDIALQAGASGYLKKPFDPAELTFVVDDLLEKVRQQAERVKAQAVRRI